jgi:hypothetical protein
MRNPLIAVCKLRELSSYFFRCSIFDRFLCRLTLNFSEGALTFELFECGKHMKPTQPSSRLT